MNTTTTTPPPPADPAAGPLTPTDHRAFAFLGQVNGCLRQCLCTLARHGVALRRHDPERARELLDAVRPWPLYKGGQFLFDLMEWEDLMVDGDPPPLMPAERIRSACTLPVQWLAVATAEAPAATGSVPGRRTAAALDLPLRLLAATARTAVLGAAQDLTDLLGTPVTEAGADDGSGHDVTGPEAGAEGTDAELPPLEAGFYLYEDVILGALAVLGPLLADRAPTGRPRESVPDPDGP
ncbi:MULTISPECIES: hypothetical protein [unclassified Streptomyces]|uniref:hypothetical protein n=1 Tax=unclassified Streptomyces TaxID=2593676 RepID=UPI0036FB9881